MNNVKKYKTCADPCVKDFTDGEKCYRQLFCTFGKPWHTNDEKRK